MDILQLEELLVGLNPQWRDMTVWEDKLRLKRDIFNKLYEDLSKNKLILALNGPRRVGKSFILKQLIAQLLRDQIIERQNTLYISFTTALNEKDIIRQAVELFLAKYVNSNQDIYIFLDEVQYLSFWQDQIKAIYDRELPVKFVVTGSTSLFYGQKSKETLLGRIEKLSVGAMSFAEYLRFKNLSYKPVNRADWVAMLPVFRTEFKKYLSGGQLPELVVDSGIEPKKYLADMVETLVNFDVPYIYSKLDRTLFTNLVKSLSFSVANEFSVNKTAKELAADRLTIANYLQILQEIGFFGTCLNGYYQKMRAKLSASKKIYSLNTSLSLAINGFDQTYLNDSRVMGAYAEDYVYVRLREKYGNKIEYFSDRKREVDFVTADMVWEVKYGLMGDTAKYAQIAQKLHRGLTIVTENEWDEKDQIRKLPIYLL